MLDKKLEEYLLDEFGEESLKQKVGNNWKGDLFIFMRNNERFVEKYKEKMETDIGIMEDHDIIERTLHYAKVLYGLKLIEKAESYHNLAKKWYKVRIDAGIYMGLNTDIEPEYIKEKKLLEKWNKIMC